MAIDIRRPHPGQWEWEENGRWRGVRAFRMTGRLIWSSWVLTSDGPQFDDGIAQTFADYLAGKPGPFPVPPDVEREIRAFIGR
ncbi:MAG: hypothetical protein NZM00_12500 [Anaerolinea sp.]|nr:hypothetical protein [Anaerolinea sp.]